MGYAPRTQELKKSLKRNSPRNIRQYNYGVMLEHSELINSFTKADYDIYEVYYHKWGGPGRQRQAMINKMIANGITGAPMALAEIRLADLYLHQKLIQIIRSRWTDIEQFKKNIINNNTDKFWEARARGIIRRCINDSRFKNSIWKDEGGEARLVDFLKKLFKKQNGLCAISKSVLELQIGSDDTCSVDRIDSNKGYTCKNMQLTTWWVNNMKVDASMETFIKRINIIHTATNA